MLGDVPAGAQIGPRVQPDDGGDVVPVGLGAVDLLHLHLARVHGFLNGGQVDLGPDLPEDLAGCLPANLVDGRNAHGTQESTVRIAQPPLDDLSPVVPFDLVHGDHLFDSLE